MSTTTLSMGCGGDGIKVPVLDCKGNIISRAVRTLTPYSLPPEKLVETIASLASRLSGADRVTAGMPGIIRHGVVVAMSHYITGDGPRSRVLPDLMEARGRFDMSAAVPRALGIPSLVPNDTEVVRAGVVTDHDLKMIVALGTGLGNAVLDNGILTPHMEIFQGPVRWGLTYDDYIGRHERLRLNDTHWSCQVCRVTDALRPMYLWDRLYLGGDNSRRITAAQLTKIGGDVVVVPNEAGMTGGARCWDMARP